jgi:hypothetical protein
MKKIIIALAITVSSALLAHDVVGGVVGGAIGGVVGNQFGGGNGKVATTIAGATLGTLIGSQDRGYEDNTARYHNDYTERTVYREAPRTVIYTQPRIVRIEPAPVYYGWNERRYNHGYIRGYERRENRYERHEDRRDDYDGWRHEWHDDDDERHDRR